MRTPLLLNPRSQSPPATAASSFLSTVLPSAPRLAYPAVSTAQVTGRHPCAAGPCHQALTVPCRGHPSLGPYLDDFGMVLVRTSVSLWSFGAQTSRDPTWRALCPLQSAPAGPGFLGSAQPLPQGAREPKFRWAGDAASLGLCFLAGEGRQ